MQACQLVQTDYDAFRRQCQSPPRLTPELRSQFEHICDTLPALWPKLPNEQKKLLLRSLIAQVILTPTSAENGQASLEVKLVWRSGHFSLLALDRHSHPFWHQLPSYPAMLQRIHALWQQGHNDKQIAHQLHDEDFPAYYPNPKLSWYNIRSLRLSQGWSVRPKASQTPPLINGCYTPRGLALACHTDKDWILRRIYDRSIDPALVSRHPQQRTHLIRASPELIDKLTLLAAQSIRKPRKQV